MDEKSLLLLENLTYLNNFTLPDGSVLHMPSVTSEASLRDYFAKYCTDEVLNQLEQSGDRYSGFMSGSEWAATLRAMRNDDSIMDLTAQSCDRDNFAICYTDPAGKAYVTFQGTANGVEWKDDVEGLNVADTECQKKALAYIESLPYDGITVVGHSKGGNKAMYVAITSDKVSRCLSMDGQGFSQEFLDKYRAEIELRGDKITNYSLDTDYVHILLFPVPGSSQRYYANGGEGGLRNHCPTAYYQFCQDADGHWQIRVNQDGTPYMQEVPFENKGIAAVHDFTCFVLNVMPDDQKADVVEYLGALLALFMGEDSYKVTVNGVTYDKKHILEFVLSDQETLALVLGYVLKYADSTGLGPEEIEALLRAFGLGDLLDQIEEGIKSFAIRHPIIAGKLGLAAGGIVGLLGLLLDQLRDGEPDPIIGKVLDLLEDWFMKDLKAKGLNLKKLWNDIDDAYTGIGDVDGKAAVRNGSIIATKKFNYSTQSYDLLLQTIVNINNQTIGSVSSWNAYASESWYNKLFISRAAQGIGNYFTHLEEINESCKAQIDRVYGEVRGIDESQAAKLRELIEAIRNCETKLRQLASAIG